MSSFVPSLPGSGGGTLSAPTPGDLTGLTVGGAAVASLIEGQLVHTITPDAYWRYHTVQDAAPSIGTVVNNAGGGQFLRDLTYHGLLDVLETSWYVDGVAGDDNAGGKTVGTPLRTWAELLRRIGNPDVLAPPSSPFIIEVFVSSPPPDVLQGDFFAPTGAEVRIINTAALAPPPAIGSNLGPATPSANAAPILNTALVAPPLTADAIIYDYTNRCWFTTVADAIAPDFFMTQRYYSSSAPTPFVYRPFPVAPEAFLALNATLMPITVGDLDGHSGLTLEGFDLTGTATITRTRLLACKLPQTLVASLCRVLACLVHGATVENCIDAGGSRFGHGAIVRGKFDYTGLMGFVSLTWYGENDLNGSDIAGQYLGAVSVAAGLGEDDTITIPPGGKLRMTGTSAIFGGITNGRAPATIVLRQGSCVICDTAGACSIPDAGSVEFYESQSLAPAPLLALNTVYDPADIVIAVPPASLSIRDRFGDNTVPGSDLNKFPGRWLAPASQAFVQIEVPNP